jgi:hypothetical protein
MASRVSWPLPQNFIISFIALEDLHMEILQCLALMCHLLSVLVGPEQGLLCSNISTCIEVAVSLRVAILAVTRGKDAAAKRYQSSFAYKLVISNKGSQMHDVGSSHCAWP